ncbi:DeoR/GlpR family DNA-binding transcription regulator [Alkalibacter mobilis]|uniref:DeoR/GlpR family DNA-binding transcription regulator n=1 Tax=Alkalibacter mobilis TaxID=2787712 RepID=UPI00189FE713|nr:DeoR/GlpR family DNA-binding transcription regulator [Alkalibacter mobilis]MBF7095584.1 DeoR/GlpR transcriptional regulator [Alkalibacter mobilis]
MFIEERYQKIVELLKEKNSVRVSDLTEIFDVSESTIRRDLQDMEEKNMLKRTHGGAVSLSSRNFEPSFKEKETSRHSDKVRIAKVAAKLVGDGDSIIIDSGTTTLELAKALNAKNITVITNSIDIATILWEKEDMEIILTGGTLRKNTRSMVGQLSENSLRNFKVDKVFLGTNGITLKDGLTTPNLTEAITKRTMMESGDKVYVLSDPSKFGVVNFAVIENLKQIDAIITTDEVEKQILDEFQNFGVRIITS